MHQKIIILSIILLRLLRFNQQSFKANVISPTEILGSIQNYYFYQQKQIGKINFNNWILANFGEVPYGATLIGQIQNNQIQNPCSSIPQSKFHNEIFLISDNLDCSFASQTLNAQSAGAIMVLKTKKDVIYTDQDNNNQHLKISIPTFYIPQKDYDLIQDVLINMNQIVQLSINFPRKQKVEINEESKVAKIDFWMNAADKNSYDFIEFARNDTRLSNILQDKNVNFSIHYAIFNCYACQFNDYQGDNVQSFINQCLQGGRYCIFNSQNQMIQFSNLNGNHIMQETLRQMCIQKVYSTDSQLDIKNNKFYQYLSNFYQQCLKNYLGQDIDLCSNKTMEQLKLDQNKITKCINESFQNDTEYPSRPQKNIILENELILMTADKVSQFPILHINKMQYKGDLQSSETARAICESIEQDIQQCLNVEKAKFKESGMSTGEIITIAFIILLLLLFAYNIYISRKIRRDMQSDIQLNVGNALSNYMKFNNDQGKI